MKYGLFVSAALAALFLASSCKKDSSASNNASGDLPKSFTEDVTSTGLGHQVETTNLNYDGDGRIVSMISASSPGNKVLYQYNADKTFSLDIYISNQVTIHSVYWIGTNGFVDSNFQYNDTQDTTTEKFTYNGANQLIQQREYDYSTVYGPSLSSSDVYTYDGTGNVIQDVSDYQTTTFDYYTDLPNKLNIENTYLPQTVNLIKTQTINSGGDPQTITHTYTFDSNNRLKVDSAVASDGGIDIKTYNY